MKMTAGTLENLTVKARFYDDEGFEMESASQNTQTLKRSKSSKACTVL